MSPQVVAKSVHDVRRILKLTQKGYAVYVGVSPSSVRRWESSAVNINPDTADKLILFNNVVRTACGFMAKDEVVGWFQTDNDALGGRKPLELANKVVGLERINEVLVSLEWGLV